MKDREFSRAGITYIIKILLPGGVVSAGAGFLSSNVYEGSFGAVALGAFGVYFLAVVIAIWAVGVRETIRELSTIVSDMQDSDSDQYTRKFLRIRDYLNWIRTQYAKEKSQNIRYTKSLENANRELGRANEILELSPIVVFEWPIPPQIPATYVSQNIHQFGYNAEELLNGSVDFYDLVHPEDLERVRRTITKARENHQDEYTYMYRILTKQGEVRWVQDWTILVRDEKGNLLSEKGVLRDVTDEVTLNDKMSESEVRFRELFENASALIFTCDFTGRFTSANRGCLSLLGFEWKELEGKCLQDFLDPAQPEVDLQDLRYLESYLNEPVELKIMNRDGITHVIETRNSLLYRDDVPNEIQTVAHNITDRKIAEAQIEYLTYHDRLTGLYNRLYFDMTMQDLEEKQLQPVTIIIGDMNGLKLANDAFGHSVGDQMLVLTGRILEESVSDLNAIVARLSGDEFAILLLGIGKIGANMVCERIRTACQEITTPGMRPSIALGFSAWDSNLTLLEESMREAEDNMYHNKLNESKSIRSAIIHSLQASLEEKTTETRAHAERLRTLALLLGKRIGLGANDMDELALAAVMHDIGKIGIPDSVLMKQGPLDEDEWLVMKKHPEVGYHIILSSPNMSKVAEFILSHHERWDGTGYPRGLQQENIPLIARIISVVDSYDVMTSDRPYKTAISSEMALLEIERCSGTQFDPLVAKAFIEMIQSDAEAEQNNYSFDGELPE